MGKYIKIITSDKMPKSRVKRLPQYDEALKEFIDSNANFGVVKMDTLPSKNPRVVLSSLKWRIKNNPQYKGTRAVMSKGKIYLEKVIG